MLMQIKILLGLIGGEIKSLWADGLLEYVSDLWNIVDFIQNSFYFAWLSLRAAAWIGVMVICKKETNKKKQNKRM